MQFQVHKYRILYISCYFLKQRISKNASLLNPIFSISHLPSNSFASHTLSPAYQWSSVHYRKPGHISADDRTLSTISALDNPNGHIKYQVLHIKVSSSLKSDTEAIWQWGFDNFAEFNSCKTRFLFVGNKKRFKIFLMLTYQETDTKQFTLYS